VSKARNEEERTLRIARSDDAVDDARRFAEKAVSFCTPECREAVALAVCELGENLIKYAAQNDGRDAGIIGVSVEGPLVRVRAVNRVSSPSDAERVAEIVTQISSAGDGVRELYRARLIELFRNPTLPRAQLGLLRMVFEGGFRLTCTFHAPELQILAERACGHHA
jgi:hypothetical protein